ncbi:MAG TPA: hypothetical protein VEK05_00915 [Burkholderiales bacterium]|nr:hypothetical protein [Burkholderiales bacterium]
MRLSLLATSLLAAVVCPALLASEEGNQARVPELPLLRTRVKEFWRAVGAHDVVTHYEMTTPTVRKRVPLEAFKKTWSWEDQPQFPVQSIAADLLSVCNCVELRLLRCTVALDLAIDQAGEPSRNERILQMWEFADGQWYEAYSGAPIERRCPRQH